jgi:hypothetical protein
MTTEQTAQVIQWVEASGKTLKHIFVTHGHGDHWLARACSSRGSRCRGPGRARHDRGHAVSRLTRGPRPCGTSCSLTRFRRLRWSRPHLPTTRKAIDGTRSYLEDAQRLSRSSQSALEFCNAMIERHPTRLNPTALWFWGAQVLFPAAVST